MGRVGRGEFPVIQTHSNRLILIHSKLVQSPMFGRLEIIWSKKEKKEMSNPKNCPLSHLEWHTGFDRGQEELHYPWASSSVELSQALLSPKEQRQWEECVWWDGGGITITQSCSNHIIVKHVDHCNNKMTPFDPSPQAITPCPLCGSAFNMHM